MQEVQDQNLNQQFLKDIQSRVFKIATRDSKLALAQVYEVIDLIVGVKELGLTKENFQICEIKNAQGDQNLKDPLYQIGGVGVFTKQVENELLNNNSDIAVHSLKDLPTIVHPELVVAAVPGLQHRQDCIIYKGDEKKNIQDLPNGSIIGTSSLRRITSLKHRYPHLQFKDIRGNLQTRFKKLDEQDYNAIILARAGLDRLDYQDKIGQIFEEKDFLHAPAQGALGVQCRKSDQNLFKLLTFIQNKEARIRVDMERQFLNKLEGGCKLPIGVYTEITNGQLYMIGQVWNYDGTKTVRQEITGSVEDQELGLKLSDLMKEKGAVQILKEINEQLEKEKLSKK